MLVLMLAKEFPYLANDLEGILKETALTREEAEKEIYNTIELYQLRLKARLIDPSSKYQKH